MGVNITIVDKNLKILTDFGYIDDQSIDKILSIALQYKFELLMFLDKCDHLFLNKKQWGQLRKEIDVLKNKQAISNKTETQLYQCFDEVILIENAYYAFIGD